MRLESINYYILVLVTSKSYEIRHSQPISSQFAGMGYLLTSWNRHTFVLLSSSLLLHLVCMLFGLCLLFLKQSHVHLQYQLWYPGPLWGTVREILLRILQFAM